MFKGAHRYKWRNRLCCEETLVDSMVKDKVYECYITEERTEPTTINDAKLVCNYLDIECEKIDIIEY